MGVLPIYMGVKGEENAGLTVSFLYFAMNKNASEKDQKATKQFLDYILNDDEARDIITNEAGFETPFKSYAKAGYQTKNPIHRANDAYAKADKYDIVIYPLPSTQWVLTLGNACGQIGETDDFDQAIAYAMKNVDLTNTLVIVTADHAHTSQILNAQPAYALSTVLKTADGNNMVVSYGTAEADSRDEDGGYNGGDMAHTGTQLRIAASGPGAQRVIGLTDQTDNFYTIANTLGLASTSDDQKSLSNDAKTEVKLTDGKYVAESTGFNGDAVLSYELKDKSGNVLAASDSSTPVSGVRVKTAQTTSIALDKVAEGNEYTLTVTGRRSGKTVTVDFQAPARDSSDEKPGDGKNDVIASGKVSNNPKSGVLGNTGAAITIAALAIAMLAAIAMIVKTAKISR